MSVIPAKVGLAADGASGKCRGDSRETVALLSALYAEMKRGEELPLALLSSLSPDQMVRQLTGEARGLFDMVMTHLARFPRETALRALEDSLDAHRRRVLPGLSDTQTLDLFGRLSGGRS